MSKWGWCWDHPMEEEVIQLSSVNLLAAKVSPPYFLYITKRESTALTIIVKCIVGKLALIC